MDDNATIDSAGIENDRQLSIVRKSFRVPVEDGRIQVVINGRSRPVRDICPEGISLACDAHTDFIAGQTIDQCRLILPKDSIEALTARIVHISNNDEKERVCGIQWVDLKDEDLARISVVVSDLKKKILADQHNIQDGQNS